MNSSRAKIIVRMKTWTLQLRHLFKTSFILSIACGLNFLATSKAEAFDYTSNYVYGVMVGLGGAGVDETVPQTSGTGTTTASSANDPGMVGISIEKFLNEKWSLALSHRRGLNFGPFSVSVHFTGVIWRRYFLRPATFLPNTKLKNSVTMQRWVPFVGLGAGIAQGSIKRENDAVNDVTGSGLYMGFHMGIDYHLRPNLILRPEFFTSATFMDTSKFPSTVQEYGLVVGFHFKL